MFCRCIHPAEITKFSTLDRPGLTLAQAQCHIAAMSAIRSVCVYCASGEGRNPAFVAAARTFGRILAENKVGLVFGGGAIGLMGALARGVLEHGGTATGIIPKFLIEKEVGFRDVTELIVTADLHERKRLMFERADAFVALPGGIGTLEELVEQLTWAQLGRHRKPILIANIEGFWSPLLETIDHMGELGFIHSVDQLNYIVCNRVEDILPMLREAAARVSEAEAGEREVIERL
jgi:uncharacterized protein (TIGR00730 family)